MKITNETMWSWIREAYIKVYGQAKWDSLTDEQKHDAIMFVVHDMLRNIERRQEA